MSFTRRYIEDDVQTTARADWISDIGNGISDIGDGITNGLETISQVVTNGHAPSPDPIIILNFWVTAGYNLQPTIQYTSINKPKTLYTSSGRSTTEAMINPFSKPSYTWYESDDKKKWTIMSSTDKNLTVAPTKSGTVYYQQRTTWPLSLTSVYSNIAPITTFPNAKDANKLDVVADNTYLYNNNQKEPDTIFVKGKPDPIDATGNITWSVDDSSLATVDKYTGLVTANTIGKSGTVEVTGQMTNNDGSVIRGSLDIRIGGGLDDVSVKEGQPAEFRIQGKYDQKPTSVVWYEVLPNKPEKVVDDSGNNMTYTIPKTSYLDDGAHFFAIITMPDGNKDVMTTNTASLEVTINHDPDVTVTNTVFNNSRDDHNQDNTVINNVSKGDQIAYRMNIIDKNTNSNMKSGIVELHCPKTLTLTNISLNGVPILGVQYTKITDSDNKNVEIYRFYEIELSQPGKNYEFEVDGIMGDVEGLPITSTTKVYGLDGDGRGNMVTQVKGNPSMVLNSTSDQNSLIKLVSHNWEYQPIINMTGKAMLIHRLKMSGNGVDVYDNRVDKKPIQLYLKQTQPLKSGDKTLLSEIRYYHKDGSYQVLDDVTGALVEESTAGESLKSVSWGKDEGPLLYLEDGDKAISGNYSTGLEWWLVDSV